MTITNIVYFYSAGIDFRRQNLTSTDVWFWRLNSIHGAVRLNPFLTSSYEGYFARS